MTDFPILLYTSTCEIPALLIKYPVNRRIGGAPRIGHYREYPPPPPRSYFMPLSWSETGYPNDSAAQAV